MQQEFVLTTEEWELAVPAVVARMKPILRTAQVFKDKGDQGEGGGADPIFTLRNLARFH